MFWSAASMVFRAARCFAATTPRSLAVAVDPVNVAEHMAACNAAMGSPGNATWERAVLGVPALLFSTNENQVGILTEMHEACVASYAGPASQIDTNPAAAADAAIGFLSSAEHLNRMAKRGFETVDGLGLRRIGHALVRVSPRSLCVEVAAPRDIVLLPYARNPFCRDGGMAQRSAYSRKFRISRCVVG